MTPNGYAKYQENQLSTASPGRLLLAAYDGTIRFCNNALEAMNNADLEQQNYHINKAMAIIFELVSSLREDVEPQLVATLKSIYAYTIERLGCANMTQEPKALEEVIEILKELRETWAEAEKIVSQATSRKDVA